MCDLFGIWVTDPSKSQREKEKRKKNPLPYILVHQHGARVKENRAFSHFLSFLSLMYKLPITTVKYGDNKLMRSLFWLSILGVLVYHL